MQEYEQYTQEDILLSHIHQAQNKSDIIEQSGKRNKEPNLLEISNAYDNYFIYGKLKVYCKYLSYSKVVNEKLIDYKIDDFVYLKMILSRLEDSKITNQGVYIYNKIRLLYELPEDTPEREIYTHIDFLRNEILNRKSEFNESDLLELYSFLTDYSVRQLNLRKESLAELFIQCNNDLLNLLYIKSSRERVYLDPGTFKNIIVIAYRIKNNNFFNRLKTNGIRAENKAIGYRDVDEWVGKFIECYSSFLADEFSNYHVYGKAFYQFKAALFEDAYFTISKYGKARGEFINVSIKVLFLITIFEIHLTNPKLLEENEVDVEKILNQLKSLLSENSSWRQPLSKLHITLYNNFLRYYKIIFKLYNKGKRYGEKRSLKYQQDVQKLITDLQKISAASEEWLIEKANSL